MEKVRQNSSEKYEYSSLFHDMRSLDGKNNSLFLFFQELCVKIWIGSRKAQTNNFLFQQTLCYCNAWENLEKFLCWMWYEMIEIFWELDECKKYFLTHKDVYFWVKKWEIHIGILYDNLTPVWIILAKQLQSEQYIRWELDFLTKKIASIINFNI